MQNRLRSIKRYAENHEQAYRTATLELQREQHEFLGFVDVGKALLMWIETTKERVRKIYPLGFMRQALARSHRRDQEYKWQNTRKADLCYAASNNCTETNSGRRMVTSAT